MRIGSVDRGSTGFHLRQVSSQLEMARRCLQCGSKVQEKARVIFGRPGVTEITSTENVKPFEGSRGGWWGMGGWALQDKAAAWGPDFVYKG